MTNVKNAMKLFSNSRRTSQKFAEMLAEETLSTKSKHALVIALIGDLGSGKTTFVRAFLRASGVRARVTSPSFLIFKRYVLRRKKFKNIYHFDLYRLKKEEAAGEINNLGWKDLVRENNVILVEWAGVAPRLIPKGSLIIRFSHGKKINERTMRVTKK